MIYYGIWDMTTGTGAKYLGTVYAKDRIETAQIVKDVLGLTKDQIMLQVTIASWYKDKPIR